MQGTRVRGGAEHHLAVVNEGGGGVRIRNFRVLGGRVGVGGGTCFMINRSMRRAGSGGGGCTASRYWNAALDT
jgi:hypothetical protein